MGNCQGFSSSRSIHDAREDESVRVVRVTDGQTFEYPGPVLVKDLLFGFEGFAIFHYSTIEHPLPPETELNFNEVYYLRPWTSPEELAKFSDAGKSVSCRKLGCLRSAHQNTVGRDRSKVKKVTFVADSRQATQGNPSRCEIFALPDSQRRFTYPGRAEMPPAMELLPQDQNGVVRVKLVISKSQLSDLMATSEKANALLDGIVGPPLSPLTNAAAVETTGPLSPKSSQKPSLDDIPGCREKCRNRPLLSSSSLADCTFLER